MYSLLHFQHNSVVKFISTAQTPFLERVASHPIHYIDLKANKHFSHLHREIRMITRIRQQTNFPRTSQAIVRYLLRILHRLDGILPCKLLTNLRRVTMIRSPQHLREMRRLVDKRTTTPLAWRLFSPQVKKKNLPPLRPETLSRDDSLVEVHAANSRVTIRPSGKRNHHIASTPTVVFKHGVEIGRHLAEGF